MSENTTINSNPKSFYFEMSDGNYILPASFLKRFTARLLDNLIYVFIGTIIIGVGFNVQFKEMINHFSVMPFDYYMMDAYYSYFLGGTILIISSIIFFGFIYPLFINKKYIGQTLGKKALGIVPMYLNEAYKPKLDYFKREIFLNVLILIFYLVILTSGYYFTTSFAYYNQYLNLLNPNDYEPISIYQFISNSDEYFGAEKFQIIFGYTGIVLNSARFIIIIVLLFSIAFGFKKRGFHDKMANTAVVDIKTITSLDHFKDDYEESVIKPFDEIDLNTFDDLSNLTLNNFQFDSKNSYHLEPPVPTENNLEEEIISSNLQNESLQKENQNNLDLNNESNLEIDYEKINKQIKFDLEQIEQEFKNL